MADGRRSLGHEPTKRGRKFIEMEDDEKFTYYGIATTFINCQSIELKGTIVKTSRTIVLDLTNTNVNLPELETSTLGQLFSPSPKTSSD